jgi:hypothetical protein
VDAAGAPLTAADANARAHSSAGPRAAAAAAAAATDAVASDGSAASDVKTAPVSGAQPLVLPLVLHGAVLSARSCLMTTLTTIMMKRLQWRG